MSNFINQLLLVKSYSMLCYFILFIDLNYIIVRWVCLLCMLSYYVITYFHLVIMIHVKRKLSMCIVNGNYNGHFNFIDV